MLFQVILVIFVPYFYPKAKIGADFRDFYRLSRFKRDLIATIDKVPCTIALPERVVDAYQQGALPLNTLANAILAKNDQMRQMAAQNYEANEQQTVIRTIAQR